MVLLRCWDWGFYDGDAQCRYISNRWGGEVGVSPSWWGDPSKTFKRFEAVYWSCDQCFPAVCSCLALAKLNEKNPSEDGRGNVFGVHS